MAGASIKKQLADSIRESERTGFRVRKIFDKVAFIQEFPKAGKDPRMAITPSPFLMETTPIEPILVEELRKLCLEKGDHPLAVQKAISVQGLGDRDVVYILREDLAILSEGVSGSSSPVSSPSADIIAPSSEEEPDESSDSSGSSDSSMTEPPKPSLE